MPVASFGGGIELERAHVAVFVESDQRELIIVNQQVPLNQLALAVVFAQQLQLATVFAPNQKIPSFLFG